MSKGRFEAYDHRIWYNAGRVRVKSRQKIQKSYDWYFDILKKEQKFGTKEKTGMSKWIYKTKLQAQRRFDKYGITKGMILTKLESKGLKDLEKYI